MSSPTPTGPQGPAAATRRKGVVFGLSARQIALIVVAAYALLLALLNLDSVKVNFVFFSTRASLVVVLALAAGIGFLVGYLFDDLRARRRRGVGG